MKKRDIAFICGCLAIIAIAASAWLKRDRLEQPKSHDWGMVHHQPNLDVVESVNAAIRSDWQAKGITPMPPAPPLAVARRLSLGLAGTVPSLEEIRTFEQQPPEQQIQWWLSHLFESQRTSDYLAERFARAFVGVEEGPFLLYRRRRFVSWLSDELYANRPYDEMVRALIAAEGMWTTAPEVNFLTATINQNEKKGPDEVKLAGRVTRAFLGVRIDCMQCHDDKFGDRWKQQHFHELAAFFQPADLSISGVRDKNKTPYRFTYLGADREIDVAPNVPFGTDFVAETLSTRQHLAHWVTNAENQAFSRSIVNRVWAFMFGRPMIAPVDAIPVDGPWPEAMTLLADDFRNHGYNLRRLIRIMAATQAFQIDSRAPENQSPPTALHDETWAAFAMTRLRPDQIAGSILQTASLKTIDADSHVLVQIGKILQQGDFIKRYGDAGEDEFDARGGTIPQRLTLMNGKLVHDQIDDNLFMHASTQISQVCKDTERAIETAYLAILSRRPTPAETNHFASILNNTNNNKRKQALQDLYWALINTTEFAWNH